MYLYFLVVAPGRGEAAYRERTLYGCFIVICANLVFIEKHRWREAFRLNFRGRIEILCLLGGGGGGEIYVRIVLICDGSTRQRAVGGEGASELAIADPGQKQAQAESSRDMENGTHGGGLQGTQKRMETPRASRAGVGKH